MLYRNSLAAIVSVAAGARSIALDILTDQFRLADYIGREVVIELDYDEIGNSIKTAAGGLVFAQIVLSFIGMLVGLNMGR